MTCGCCNKDRPIVGVGCVPGIAMSIGWCQKCLISGAIPYDMAVANTACCGGLEFCNEAWRQLILTTLKYFEKSLDEFNRDVACDILAMERLNDAPPN